jgi:hypothetical protein
MELLQVEFARADPESLETYKLLVWFLVSALGLAIVIIAFFLKREVFPSKTERDEKKEYEELRNKKSEDKEEYDYEGGWKTYVKSQEEKWHNFEQRQQESNNERKEQIEKLENLIKDACLNIQGISTMVEVIRKLDGERYPRLEQKVLEIDRQVHGQAQELVYIRTKIGINNGFGKSKFGDT